MQVAAILFVAAALGGLIMVGIRLSGATRPPTWLALGHGAIALAGLGTLIWTAMNPGLPDLAQWALAAFVLAAAGGLVVFFGFHLRHKPLPIPLILGHGAIAATGLTLLLVSLFRDR